MHTRSSVKRKTSSIIEQGVQQRSRVNTNSPSVDQSINQSVNQSVDQFNWRIPPSFILSTMLSFMDGHSVAVHSRINSTWRSQLQSCTSSGQYALDADIASAHHDQSNPVPMESAHTDSFDYGDESSYDVFSTQTDAVLYDAFQAARSNIHSLRSLKLSTTRLTKPACQLLGHLIFLESIELRLFESVASEWHRECLSSQQLAWNTESNHPLNHFNPSQFIGSDALFVDERVLPALSYTQLHDAAVRSFSQSLQHSLHKLCHLKSLTVVSFLDYDAKDACYDSGISSLYPVLREQSRAIVEALMNHPTLEEVVFVEPRLLHCSQSFHPAWLDTIPNLRSVQVIDPVSAFPSQSDDFKNSK